MTAPTPYEIGPYDQPHLYAQWGGKLPGGEEWSNGIRFRAIGAHTVASGDVAAMLAPLTTAITAFHTRATTLVHNTAKLSYVKLNAIAVDGTYMSLNTNEQIVADVGGGSTAVCPPNQIAMVVTWLTSFTRGPAHKGRIYLPLPATQLDTDGIVSTVSADGIKASAATFLTALNAVSADYEAAVFSRKAGNPGNNKIQAPSVGRVLDTQRRRRRSLAELYR